MVLLPPALQAAAASSNQLHLKQRALHVFLESQRVLQFKQVCADDILSGYDKLSQLGALMDASHASCAGLYCCSCPELDALVGVAKAAGALGARLTGEGTLGVHAGAGAATVGAVWASPVDRTWLLQQREGLVTRGSRVRHSRVEGRRQGPHTRMTALTW
jgi:hypothetical protein